MSRLRMGLAEFVLIVVSVFLAVAAERWVSGKSERELASQYTSDLREDLASDSSAVELWTGNANRRALALQRLLGSLNGTEPSLVGDEVLATLFVAQIVPIPNFQLATYQDLVSSGNLRLLSPGVRRALVRYHDALAALDRRMALTGYHEKPPFADLLPAMVRQQFLVRCRGTPAVGDCVGREAEELLAAMSRPERTSLGSWSDRVGIRLELERTLNGTFGFLDALAEVADTRDRTAAALSAAVNAEEDG